MIRANPTFVLLDISYINEFVQFLNRNFSVVAIFNEL